MAEEVYECTLSGNLHGQFVQTVWCLWYDNTTAMSSFGAALAIAQYLSTATVMDQFMGCLPEDYSATSLRVKKVMTGGGPTAIVLANTFSTSVGTRTGEISSAQVNPLVTWIGIDHPSNTGRTFLPGVSEADIDGMALSATLITAINTWIGSMKDPFTVSTTDDSHFCIFTRPRLTPVVIPAAFDKFLDGQLSPLIGTQRKRLHPI